MGTGADLITITGAPKPWPAPALVKALIKSARGLKLLPAGAPVALSVSFVSATKMSEFNGRFRNKAGPTDVLSFEVPDMDIAGGLLALGDLVICIPVLKAQAKTQDHSPRQELAVLLAHGFLHLLGYDHERGRGATLLQARMERRLLDAMGFKTVAAGLISRNGQ
jgi:rRNA maturation RNase YbeY